MSYRIIKQSKYLSGTYGAKGKEWIVKDRYDYYQNPLEFETIDEAEKHIKDIDSGNYYLSHGEYSRPTYTIVDYNNFSYEKHEANIPNGAIEISDPEIIERLNMLEVEFDHEDEDTCYFRGVLNIDEIDYYIMFAIDQLEIFDNRDDLGCVNWDNAIYYTYNS